MKANVKYNSFVGSAAADLSESVNLKQLLLESGYDANRYEPLGLDVIIESGSLAIFVICIDKLNYDANSKMVSKCLLKNNNSVNFNKIFKHLNIFLFSSHLNSEDYISENNKVVYFEGNMEENSDKELDVF